MENGIESNRIESNQSMSEHESEIEKRTKDRQQVVASNCLAAFYFSRDSLTFHSFNESQVRVGLDGGGERGCRIGRQTRPMHFLYHFGLMGVVVRAPYPSDQRQTRAVSATIAWLAVLHELSGSINIICCVLHSSQLSALPFGISPSRLFVI